MVGCFEKRNERLNMEQFDITLVYFNALLHNTFLSIIKHLGEKYKICVWVAPYYKAKRTIKTNKLFIDYCRELGATILEKQKIKTKLLFVTHVIAVSKEYLETDILAYIQCEKKISMQAFFIFGHDSGKALLEAGFKKHIVFDRKLYDLLLKEEDRYLLESLDIYEMGNIISSYPVFDNFHCDYLIAIPTQLSFETETSTYIFIRNLLNLLNKLDKKDSVYIKLHTARDYEVPFKASRLFLMFNRRNILSRTAGNVLILLNLISGNYLIKNRMIRNAIAGALYRKVLDRCIPLSNVNKFWNFGVELFMPGIKKGLITGRSSVTWFALTQKIPVFNCDVESIYQKTNYLNAHFRHYGVPFYDGNLTFDEKHWEKVLAKNDKFDFIEFIQSEINGCV